MTRVIILEKVFWEGRRAVTKYQVLEDITNKSLQKQLDEMNAPYRNNLWRIIGDYDITKRKDAYAYAEYCLKCAENPHNKDAVSRERGLAMLKSLIKYVPWQ